MNQNQNSDLTKATAARSAEQKKTTPPTSQAKPNTSKAKTTGTSLPSSRTATAKSSVKKSAPRKHVRPLQTIGQTQRSYDDALDEALDDAFDEFIEAEPSQAEEIPVDAPEGTIAKP